MVFRLPGQSGCDGEVRGVESVSWGWHGHLEAGPGIREQKEVMG